MKNLKKVGIILLIISIIMSLINITPVVGADTYENYVADKQVKGLNLQQIGQMCIYTFGIKKKVSIRHGEMQMQ